MVSQDICQKQDRIYITWCGTRDGPLGVDDGSGLQRSRLDEMGLERGEQ